MPYYKNNNGRLLTAFALTFWLLLLVALPVKADEFSVNNVNGYVQGDRYLLDATIRYTLSEPVRETLLRGVPLTFVLDIEVQRQRGWWLDADVKQVSRRFQLSYHPLYRTYRLLDEGSGERYLFQTEEGALSALGNIRQLPLLLTLPKGAEDTYIGYLRVWLSLSDLPLPLRTTAYFSPSWRLNSQWYRWQLDF